MNEAPQPNTPEARTPTGELLNQAVNQPLDPSLNPTPTPDPSTSAKPDTTSSNIPADPKPTDAKPDAKPTIPEKYEIKAPDGYDLNETVVAEASTLFKEMGLTNDQAQKLVDFQAKLQKDAAEAPYAAYDAMREDWQSQVKADPELGPKLPQVKETIGRALDSLGDATLVASFREAMNLTGAGDHPAFIKAFYKLAQAVNEGTPVRGTNPSPLGQTPSGKVERPSAAAAMYPNLAKS